MGEPGTKELLSLEELEAAGGMHTGRKHTLSILTENKDVQTEMDSLKTALEKIYTDQVKPHV